MQALLDTLRPADYTFLVGILEGKLTVNLVGAGQARTALEAYRQAPNADTRAALDRRLEEEIRYLGSADLAYWARSLSGREPGVPFREIVDDVAGTLKLPRPRLGTDREAAEAVVEAYATQQFADLTPEEQQQMLESLGVERDKAAAFLVRSAGVFSIPLMIQAFNQVIVQGLIKQVIFGSIARLLGSRLAGQLFGLLAARLPWWVAWVGPAAWTLSLGWTAVDLQGPARRKTVPIVLYLGLCSLRERHGSAPG